MADKYVIAQKPNPPIIVAGIAWVVTLLTDGTIASVAQITMYVALLYWAYLEVTSGINAFRKILGLVAGAYASFQLVWLLLAL